MSIFSPRYAPQANINRSEGLDLSKHIKDMSDSLFGRYDRNNALSKDIMDISLEMLNQQRNTEKHNMLQQSEALANALRQVQVDTMALDLQREQEAHNRNLVALESFENTTGLDPALLSLFHQYGYDHSGSLIKQPRQFQPNVANVNSNVSNTIPNVSSNNTIPNANQEQVEAIKTLFSNPTYDEQGNIDARGKFIVYKNPETNEETIVNPDSFSDINQLNILRSLGIVDGSDVTKNISRLVDKEMFGDINDDNPFFKNNPKMSFFDPSNNFSRLNQNLNYNPKVLDSVDRSDSKTAPNKDIVINEANFFNTLKKSMDPKDFKDLFIGKDAIGSKYGSQAINFLINTDKKYESLKGKLIQDPQMYRDMLELMVKGNSTTDVEEALTDKKFSSLGDQDRNIITNLFSDVKEFSKFSGKSRSGIGYAYDIPTSNPLEDTKTKTSDMMTTNLKLLNDTRLNDYVNLQRHKQKLNPNAQLNSKDVKSALEFVKEKLTDRPITIPPRIGLHSVEMNKVLDQLEEKNSSRKIYPFNSSKYNDVVYGKNNKAVKKRLEESLKILMRANSSKRHKDLNPEIQRVLEELFNTER